MTQEPAAILTKVLEKYGTIQCFQADCGLDITGYLRDEDLRTAEIVLKGGTAVPLLSRVHEVYGKAPFRDVGNGRVQVDEQWALRNIQRTKLHTGQVVFLHHLCSAEFAALFRKACDVSGYTPRVLQTWVPRRQLWDATRPLSAHAYGIAVDFDPLRNRLGGDDSVTGGPSLLRKHLEFVEVFEQAGWSWGGYQRSREDCHFQRAWY